MKNPIKGGEVRFPKFLGKYRGDQLRLFVKVISYQSIKKLE